MSLSQSSEINEKCRRETIDSLLQRLKEKYIYTEIALKMEIAVRERQKKGEYYLLTDGSKLAAKLSAAQLGVFDDRHLKVSYSAKPITVNSAQAGSAFSGGNRTGAAAAAARLYSNVNRSFDLIVEDIFAAVIIAVCATVPPTYPATLSAQ